MSMTGESMNGDLRTKEEVVTRRIVAGLSLFVVIAVSLVLMRARTSSPATTRASLLLPTVNALLNATSAVLLSVGYVLIRNGKRAAHQTCMVTAFVVSSMFLITYLVHHAQVGNVPFAGPEWLRPIYLSVLIPHIVLSAVIVPMALITLTHAWRGRFAPHRRIARWTLPLWLYVSVSGVLVYWMLYRL